MEMIANAETSDQSHCVFVDTSRKRSPHHRNRSVAKMRLNASSDLGPPMIETLRLEVPTSAVG
jgi:hypothetical protein